jgi:hypothetical protein
VRPADALDPGFVDAPDDPTVNQPIDQPLPISPAAREATRESYNPFADGTDEEEDETPRKKRYFQPKDDYNPFAEEPASQSAGGNANPEEVFDFGVTETSESTPSPGDFDFGSGNTEGDSGPRKRRR